MLAQLTDRGVTRFAIVGHDWGGTVGYLIAALAPASVSAVVVVEEILPGIDVDITEPGHDHYPAWHGPFNRAPGLAEALVPGREPAYYGTFLRQSAGPAGLDAATEQSYLAAYDTPGFLEAGLAYYRTRDADIGDVRLFASNPIVTPVLAIGGRCAMAPPSRTGCSPSPAMSPALCSNGPLTIPRAGARRVQQRGRAVSESTPLTTSPH
ncbi:alpha/beta fold hydrolase [Luethyella okanaganae]|uniref:Alpha/beta fold hydrolase n=1 Tax=Luethyella okanaganae TaxID=69372 RepID=A0ABW1VF58_9MICO